MNLFLQYLWSEGGGGGGRGVGRGARVEEHKDPLTLINIA